MSTNGFLARFLGLFLLGIIGIAILDAIVGNKLGSPGAIIVVIVCTAHVCEEFSRANNRFLDNNEYRQAFVGIFQITTLFEVLGLLVWTRVATISYQVVAISLLISVALRLLTIWLGFWAGRKRVVKKGLVPLQADKKPSPA